MAKIMGPGFLALQVHDLEKSKEFYTEALGLKVHPFSSEDAAVFDTQPIPFAVRKALVPLDTVSQLGHGVVIWLLADNSQDVYQKLKERGAKIVKEPTEGRNGVEFRFQDPDGYVINVYDKP